MFPSLLAGKAIRRKAWEGKRHLALQETVFTHRCVTRFEFASEGSWPSPRELPDMLAEDWEVVPSAVFDPRLSHAHQMALEVLTAALSESSSEMPADELALSAVTALVQLRSRDKVDDRFERLRDGATKAFLALAAFLEQREEDNRPGPRFT